jgi:selenide,water dikinase
MSMLNKIGEILGKLDYVKAMTDVTGFGLLGHLSEMCEGSNLQAVIEFEKVPKIKEIEEYLDKNSVPGGTTRNWNSYGHKIASGSPVLNRKTTILADPQTSGGLLVAVEESKTLEFEQVLRINGIPESNIVCFGTLQKKTGDFLVEII